MSHLLRFDHKGRIDCLYTEVIDLRCLGKLDVIRATDIRFNASVQAWEVTDPENGTILHSDPSREACLRWERENLIPPRITQPAVSP